MNQSIQTEQLLNRVANRGVAKLAAHNTKYAKYRQDLRAVIRKCRPDWDITTTELKAAWQQGRKDLFYPYGKTYAQTLGELD